MCEEAGSFHAESLNTEGASNADVNIHDSHENARGDVCHGSSTTVNSAEGPPKSSPVKNEHYALELNNCEVFYQHRVRPCEGLRTSSNMFRGVPDPTDAQQSG